MTNHRCFSILAALAMCTSAATAQPAASSQPTPEDVAAFCGTSDRDLSKAYSERVIAEIKRRESLGAKTVSDALREMRSAYCDVKGGQK